jgi:hypothetical protein
MSQTSLTETCFELVGRDIAFQKISGFEDLERVNLLSGGEGGGIKLYKADKISRAVLVDFKLGDGVPVPHHENRLTIGAEVFQLAPDFTYKLPIWGINSVIMKDGTYYFDSDFSFGFDLVEDYYFTMKYLEPFQEVYRKFSRHPDLQIVPLSDLTTWVRTYISPVFISAIATVDKLQPVYDLAEELIKLWVRMHADAGPQGDDFKEKQRRRIQAQYAGMKNTDRMGKILLGAFGGETFGKFFKAMSS